MVVGVGSKNISGSFIEIIEKQGWQGLWASNAINMLRIVPTQAIEPGTFECVKRAMTLAQEKWSKEECLKVQIDHVTLNYTLNWISPIAEAGATQGVVSTLVCHPLEVLKDRLIVSHDIYQAIWIGIKAVISFSPNTSSQQRQEIETLLKPNNRSVYWEGGNHHQLAISRLPASAEYLLEMPQYSIADLDKASCAEEYHFELHLNLFQQ